MWRPKVDVQNLPVVALPPYSVEQGLSVKPECPGMSDPTRQFVVEMLFPSSKTDACDCHGHLTFMRAQVWGRRLQSLCLQGKHFIIEASAQPKSSHFKIICEYSTFV